MSRHVTALNVDASPAVNEKDDGRGLRKYLAQSTDHTCSRNATERLQGGNLDPDYSYAKDIRRHKVNKLLSPSAE